MITSEPLDPPGEELIAIDCVLTRLELSVMLLGHITEVPAASLLDLRALRMRLDAALAALGIHVYTTVGVPLSTAVH